MSTSNLIGGATGATRVGRRTARRAAGGAITVTLALVLLGRLA